jgi:hypothetical protein
MIIPVMYGCENLVSSEEYRLRVFENRVLRRIFGPKKEEVEGDSRRLHNEALHNLYALTNIIRVIKWRLIWMGHVTCMGEMRSIWIPRSLSLGVKRPWLESDHSPSSSSEVKNGWIHISTLPTHFHGVVLS